jgi:hypothetical protein
MSIRLPEEDEGGRDMTESPKPDRRPAIRSDCPQCGRRGELEFPVPDDDHAALMIAKAAAQEVDLPLLVLDQLLWAIGNFDSAKAVTTDWPA